MPSVRLITILLASLCIVVIAWLACPAAAAPPLRLSPNKLSDGTEFSVYLETLSANGGTAPYAWSLTGPLPPGLTFAPAGASATISGVPTAVGTFNFRVTLTDSALPAAGTDFIDYSVTITAGTCGFPASSTGAVSFGAIDPSTTPGPIVGTVTQQIQVTCQAGKSFTVTANPAGGWSLTSGANSIPFTLGFIASGTGVGATPVDLLTTGSQILMADYQNAPAGIYANGSSITLTVSWTGPPGSIVASVPAGAVSGMIPNTCLITQTAGILAFAIDPSTPLTTAVLSPAGQDLMVKCTKDASVSVASSSKCGGLAENGSAGCGGFLIPYTFNYTASALGAGFGAGLDLPLGIGGSASQAAYADAPAGVGYGDVQTLTITY